MSDAEVKELRRQLKTALYEVDFLQKRLDAIRAGKDELNRLLDTPTFPDRMNAGQANRNSRETGHEG